YGSAAYLFAVPDRLAAKLAPFHAVMRSFYGERSVLAMYGTDHAVPARNLVELVDGVNAQRSGYEMRLQTLEGYIAAARAADVEAGRPLQLWEGELASAARANRLPGVTSARIDLKQAAGRAERWLERYAEPLQALHGEAWPERLLELAWGKVVECSAHDSICGCSVDPVVAQVISRFAEAEQIARGLAERAVARLAGGRPTGEWLVLDPSPVERADLVRLDLLVPEEWPAVALELPDGRRLATQEIGRNRPLLHESLLPGTAIAAFLDRRLHGRELFGRFLNGFVSGVEGDRRWLTLLVDDVEDPPWLDVEETRAAIDTAVLTAPEAEWRVRILAAARRTVEAMVPAPALGWTSVRPVAAAGGDGPTVPDGVVVGERSLRNGRLAVEVEADGSLRIEGGGVVLSGACRLVDGGDFGDSYNHGPPGDDRLVETPRLVSVERAAGGPLRGSLVVRRTYDWPVGVTADGSARTAETLPTEVLMSVELRAEEPFVRLDFTLENRSRDHRLRCHVPLARPATTSAAAGSFAVVERGLEVEAGHGEVPLPTFPAQQFVAAGGAAALLEHVMEYELVGVTDGRATELALTLLRSTGLISRNANPYREDPAGPERPIPDAQCLRPWQVRFALLPYAGEWPTAGIQVAAEAYRAPFLAAPGGDGLGTLLRGAPDAPRTETPPSGEGLRLDGDGATVLSALRRRGDWLEVRLMRLSATGGRVRVVLPRGVAEARGADLLGREGEPLFVRDGILELALGPWEIATVRLRS
ncbi:MAG TPA: hypothetical protein VFK38_06360, partial [Candidatus Limnocylindrales bacterium]|nr:hypothetical protein [Candidatus Limnocylindrales bacterium]